jgi:hypothetical protein
MVQHPGLRTGIAAAVAIAGAAWFVLSESESDDGPEPEAEAAAIASKDRRRAGCVFQEGQRLALQLKRSSVFWVNPAAVMDKAMDASLGRVQSDSVSDEWVMLWDVERVEAKGALVRMIGVESGLPRRATKLSEMRSKTPVLIKVQPNCKFSQIGAEDGVHPALLRDWQSLLTLMEFVWPRRSGQSWSTVQADPTGEYSANYTLADDGTLDRERVEFISTVPPRPGIKATASVVGSDASAQRDGDFGWVTTLNMREHVQVDVEGAGRFADVNTTLSLRAVDVPDHPFWDESIDMDLVAWTDAHKLGGAGQGGLRFSGDPVDPALLRLPLEQLLATFGSLLGEDRVGAFRILVHWLRHDPTRAQQLLDGIRTGAIPGELHDEMFHALSLAGGPEARAALLEAATSSDLSTANHLQALAALKGAPGVHSETVSFLTEVWSERADPPSLEDRSALLAAGALLDRPDTPDEFREALEDVLKSALIDSDSSDETSAALGAIGNTHDPSFADIVEPLLDHENEQTRLAALETMNRIGEAPPPEEALDALMEMSTIRGQKYASNALKDRASDATDEHIRWAIELLNDSETTTYQRGALIEFLGALVDRPIARMALIAWFELETDPDLLVLIGRYISGSEL